MPPKIDQHTYAIRYIYVSVNLGTVCMCVIGSISSVPLPHIRTYVCTYVTRHEKTGLMYT